MRIKPLPAAFLGCLIGIVLGSLATALVQGGHRRERGAAPASGVERPGAPSGAAPRTEARAAPATAEESPAAPALAAGPGDAAGLRAQVASLEAQARQQAQVITELRAQVADEQAQRAEIEGVPVEWPADTPDRFRADALRTAFTAALAEAGFQGEVSDIDCNEYPCIVYGKIDDDDGTTLDRLQATKALAPYEGQSNHTSAWGGIKRRADGEHREAVFGIALYPRERDEARRSQIDRRLRIRHQAFWEQVKADEAP